MHMYLWSTLGFTRDQMLCCCNWMSTIYIVGLINLVWGGGRGRALLLKKQTQNTLKIKGLVQCFCTDKEAQGNEGPIQGHAPTRNRGPFSTLLPRVSVPWLPPSFLSPFTSFFHKLHYILNLVSWDLWWIKCPLAKRENDFVSVNISPPLQWCGCGAFLQEVFLFI